MPFWVARVPRPRVVRWAVASASSSSARPAAVQVISSMAVPVASFPSKILAETACIWLEGDGAIGCYGAANGAEADVASAGYLKGR